MKTFSQCASVRQRPHTRKVARVVVNIVGGNSEISSLITLYIENDMLTLPPCTLSFPMGTFYLVSSDGHLLLVLKKYLQAPITCSHVDVYYQHVS